MVRRSYAPRSGWRRTVTLGVRAEPSVSTRRVAPISSLPITTRLYRYNMTSVSIQYTEGARTAAGIAEEVEAAVRRGRLRPGDPLPAVRRFAFDTGVSPGTVAGAYRLLRERGMVTTRIGSGTVVSYRPPLGSAWPGPIPRGVRDLATGNPDPDLLPSLKPVLSRLERRPRLYEEPPNLSPLVDLARRRFASAGVPSGPISVVSGALDGVERVLQANLRPGDRVAVEDPAYHAVLDLLGALGMGAEPVRIDDRGPVPSAVESAMAAGVEAIIVTPRSQNPFGASVDEDRARELRAVLRRHPDVLLVEDDHAGPVSGRPLVPLATAERSRWAVVHSVSKSLGPDLRVAVVVGDPATMDRVEGRRLIGPGWVSRILQQAVALLWADPGTRRQLGRAARTYTTRRRALLEILSRRGIQAHGRTGMNVWVPVPDEARTVQGLLDEGWAVRGGEPFRLRTPPAIRVTVSTLQPPEAERLAAALEGVLRPAFRFRSA
jgi:DNA-binding transcriptional MocR family regulator